MRADPVEPFPRRASLFVSIALGTARGCWSPKALRSRAMDRAPDSLVGATAADVAAHCLVDIRVGRVEVLAKQRCRAHDLTGLAIAALRNLLHNPGQLQGMSAVGRKSLNRRDVLAGNFGHRGDAGTNGVAVQVHGARP